MGQIGSISIHSQPYGQRPICYCWKRRCHGNSITGSWYTVHTYILAHPQLWSIFEWARANRGSLEHIRIPLRQIRALFGWSLPEQSSLVHRRSLHTTIYGKFWPSDIIEMLPSNSECDIIKLDSITIFVIGKLTASSSDSWKLTCVLKHPRWGFKATLTSQQ